jgi:hypothetical protein
MAALARIPRPIPGAFPLGRLPDTRRPASVPERHTGPSRVRRMDRRQQMHPIRIAQSPRASDGPTSRAPRWPDRNTPFTPTRFLKPNNPSVAPNPRPQRIPRRITDQQPMRFAALSSSDPDSPIPRASDGPMSGGASEAQGPHIRHSGPPQCKPSVRLPSPCDFISVFNLD